MSQLTANTRNVFEYGDYNDLPVADNVVIYQGSAVGIVVGTGLARQLVAADAFAGFATAKADNTVTGHTAGGITVDVKREGFIVLTVTAAITDIGASVYASDGNTYTLTSTSNTLIGTIHRWISATQSLVRFRVA